MSGEVLPLFRQKLIPHSDGRVIIDSIEDGVERLVELEKVRMDKLQGIVGRVRGIKMDSDDMIRSSPTIRWGNTKLRKELSSRLKVDVIIENDVNLMTIGEFYKGQGQNIANFVYLFIGNGIGSGLFLNEKFYKG